ncbi:TonB-dependent receptor [Leptospira fletcheri]|uniref:TonB-dependent receptor n=1 Tax=Leptospira fletcheri TaxID=2484981 RepID=A0A4V3JE44_9LEPT|nr:TonB-dependent receptor [Leptospira fletcheri]TGK14045.1 TonB-dependent receptor [Leptospira fletcheri]
MGQNQICRYLFVIYLFFLSTTTNAQSILEHVYVGQFLSYDSKLEPEISKKAVDRLKSRLESLQYSVEILPASSPEENLKRVSKGNLYISGFYRRDKATGKLVLYGHIYNSEKGILIDAYNSYNEVQGLEEIKDSLPKDEGHQSDESVLEQFVQKIVLSIRINKNKLERRENINEYVLSNPISKRFSFPVQKEDIKKSTEQVFDLLQSQVSTASTKTEVRTHDAPDLVSVISDKELLQFGRISLNDVLGNLPGYAPSQDYDRSTVSYRGMFEGWNNNHLLMLVDGVQFNDNLYGSAYTSEITPLNMLKSVEVVRGPGSALYGSNAMNGIISLNTISGKDLNGEMQTRARVGTGGTQIYDFRTGNTGKLFDYVLSYNSYQTNGNNYKDYDGSGRTDITGANAKFAVQDARSNYYLFTKLEGKDALEGLSFQYHRQYWNFQTGHGWLWAIPDYNGPMSEYRDIGSMKYKNKIGSKLTHEYVLQYQNHSIDWNTRYEPNGGSAGFYPAGVTEYLKTNGQSMFGRAQLTYDLGNAGSILAGVETTRFLYTGDKSHYANANLTDAADSYPPFPNNANGNLGPWLAWIKDKPVWTVGVFGQMVSPKFFYDKLQLTIGVRNDQTVQHYLGIDNPYSGFLGFPYAPHAKRVFRKTSPKAALVYTITRNLNLKLMGGQAFRTPSITEMFGANTFSLASNPRQLRPEIVRDYEAAIDWYLNQYVNFRVNYFIRNFQNQIFYSLQNNNLSTNIYSAVTNGAEAEINFTYNRISGFINYSYAHRLSEKMLDKTVSASQNQMTWAPSHIANGGIRYQTAKFEGSIQAHFQGTVYRRASDFGTIDTTTGILQSDSRLQYPQYRPNYVRNWTNVDVRIAYHLTEKISIGLFASNLLNNQQKLIKINNFPFDYSNQQRQILVDLNASF